jgi:DNA-binding NarL/FixJ family response regulator
MREVRRIRVLIADDHALVRSGLRSILETEPEIDVSARPGTGTRLSRLRRSSYPT